MRCQSFCRPARQSVYRDLGFNDYAVKLALRPDKRFGSDAMWDQAEEELRQAVQASGLSDSRLRTKFEELPGEGAFYAPKLEFHLTDAIGRTWQVGTIQSDRVLPERLDASYVGADGATASPGDAPPRDPWYVRAIHRHPDRASCRPLPALAGAGPGGGGDDRV